MFCENCKKEFPEGTAMCPNCGAVLTSSAPSPVTGAPVVSQPVDLTAAPKKKGKGLIIGLVAAALAVVATTVGVFAYPSILKSSSPISYISYAGEKTDKLLAKEQKPLNALTGSSVVKDIKKGVYSQSFGADFSNFSIGQPDVDEILKGIKGEVKTVTDNTNKKAYASLSASAMDSSIDLSAYIDSKTLAVKAPFADSAYKINCDGFVEKFNKSELAQTFGEIDKDTKFDFSEFFTETSAQDAVADIKDFDKKLFDIFKNNSEVKKDGSASFPGVEGKTFTAINIKPDEKSLNDWQKEVLKSVTDKYFSDNNPYNAYLKVGEADIADVFEEISFKSPEFTYYFNSKDILVGYTAKLTATDENKEDVKVAVSYIMQGEANLVDDISININMEYDGETAGVTLNSKGNHIPQDGKFTDTTKVSLTSSFESDKPVEFTVETEWDNNKTEDNLKCSVKANDFSVILTASYTADAGKKSVSFALNSIGIEAGSVNMTLKCNIYYTLAAASADDIKDISADAVDFFEADLGELQEKLADAVDSLSGLIAPDYGYGYDDFDDFDNDDFNMDDFDNDDFNMDDFDNDDFNMDDFNMDDFDMDDFDLDDFDL